ncbi:hypothetical protein TSUD_381200 [Trifolium subterraneum]|uniref:CW-type domain-containing protein n=1 Tax=Trifolium subterraneum TaxID=3900 RepID=A0A2Z6N4H8_TRISU|nr:hypothetical protein TSUD_381200 [Trifolium subterraneum]
MAENNPIEVAAPQLIAENWVACDSCQKWRLLPTGLKPEQLPVKWPGMNSCDFSEDETTKALYQNQKPVSEDQNKTHASETAFGVSSADALQFGLNHNKSSSDILLDQSEGKDDVMKDQCSSNRK